jgi:trimeric autotransporter adhesin
MMALNQGDLFFQGAFNDATRYLQGGLWQNVVSDGNSGNGSVVNYTTDLQFVQQGIQALL